jgi:hypothetical protein
MELTTLYSILNTALPNKVFYGTNAYDNEDNVSMPFIVYQEVTKRPSAFKDDKPLIYKSSVQITLVTKSKDVELESKLEKALLDNSLVFSLLSEFRNEDKSLNRVYEIYMEEI